MSTIIASHTLYRRILSGLFLLTSWLHQGRTLYKITAHKHRAQGTLTVSARFVVCIVLGRAFSVGQRTLCRGSHLAPFFTLVRAFVNTSAVPGLTTRLSAPPAHTALQRILGMGELSNLASIRVPIARQGIPVSHIRRSLIPPLLI